MNRINKWAMTIIVAIAAQYAGASVIYYDDFSGDSGANLRNTIPDITVSGNAWISASTTPWSADGSIAESDTAINRTAYLAFTPEAGKVYTLSLDMNPTGLKSGWFGLGFLGSGAAVGGSLTESATGASPWLSMLPAHDSVRTYAGTGIAGNLNIYSATVPGADWSGMVNVQIVLDTTASQWTAEWLVNGDSVRTYTYASGNPSISYVGFSRQTSVGGSVDNFELSVIPEPASVGLFIIAGAGIIFCRRLSRS